VTKVIGHFNPVSNRTLEEAEEHYVRIHTVFARGMFREHAPALSQYVINRAIAMYDVTGTFQQKPRAWRWVFMEFEGESWLPEWAAPLLWRDHTNTLKDSRSGHVEATELLNRLNGQTATASYLFEYERGEVPAEEADEYYVNDHLPRLNEYLEDAFGIRKVVSNRVLNQWTTAPMEEAGQIVVGDEEAEPSRRWIEEYYFDNHTWAGEFFARPQVRELFNQSRLFVSGYRTQQESGLDRR
jgi:hypothetical protein